MGMYKHVRDLWRKPRDSLGDVWKERLAQWRAEPVTVRIPHATRIDRARSLGYKAKQGYILVRQRVRKGGHVRPNIVGGRKPKNTRQRMTLQKSYQTIAQERANKAYTNCEVLNSYYVGEDGESFWYEVILIDTAHPVIKADPRISWISEKQHAGRAYRGLTSSAKKSRGLRKKGTGSEKTRPSRNASYMRKRLHQTKMRPM